MESQDGRTIDSLDGSNVQEAIKLLIPKTTEENTFGQILLGSPDNVEAANDVLSVTSANRSSVNSSDSDLSMHEAEDIIDHEGQAVQLEDGTTAFVHNLNDESSCSESLPRFFDGQAVQLEDGTTAYIHTTPKEGLHAVQLEDGTTAYISAAPPGALFDEDGTSLVHEHLECSQGSDQEAEKEINVVASTINKQSSIKSPSLSGEKGFRCEFGGCGRFYSTQHHLKVHERSHTGDRPFACKVYGCSKAFTTSYGLKSHIRVHTGETPYKCPDKNCIKAFKTSGDLQKHVRIHTGERPFKCPFDGCNRAFTTSNIQKVHIRTHTGERPYLCKEEGCGRAFASATNFKNHIRIHTGEKPYTCPVIGCGKRFTEYSSLYKHHVVHTHSKPYTCFLCGRHYRQTSTLSMHKRNMHGIVDTGDEDEEDALETSRALQDSTVDIKVEEKDVPDRESLREKTRLHHDDALSKSIIIEDNVIVQDETPQSDSSNGQHYVVVTLPADIVSLEQLAKDACLGQLTTNADGSVSLQLTKQDTKAVKLSCTT